MVLAPVIKLLRFYSFVRYIALVLIFLLLLQVLEAPGSHNFAGLQISHVNIGGPERIEERVIPAIKRGYRQVINLTNGCAILLNYWLYNLYC